MPEVNFSPTADADRKFSIRSNGIGDSDAFPLFDNGSDDEIYAHPEEEKWGFRITGGAEFKMPVVVFQVTEGGLAAENGIKLGDVILKINGIDASRLTLSEARKIIQQAEHSLELLAKKMEDENEMSGDEKMIVLKPPIELGNLEPPRELVLPKAEPRVWHPVMWHHPPKASDEGLPGQEPPHLRIIRNIRRFFKENQDNPDLRKKHIEDMLLALPGASKLDESIDQEDEDVTNVEDDGIIDDDDANIEDDKIV